MKETQFHSNPQAFQRLEATGQRPAMMPPGFNPTASAVQRTTESSSEQLNAEETSQLTEENMQEQGLQAGDMEQTEQFAFGKMNEALDGQSLNAMTEQSMPLMQSSIPGKLIKIFYFKGVQFLVIDVGGDENARSREVLNQSIRYMEWLNQKYFADMKPRRRVRMYIGDYRKMKAFAQANPQLPYREYMTNFNREHFGDPWTGKTDNGQLVPKEGARIAQSFVKAHFVPEFSDKKQRNHNAIFMEMSRIDRWGLEASDPYLKQILDLAMIIGHEGTHTLTKDGGHTGGFDEGHLMEAGGPWGHLASLCKVTDPKTGKETIDMEKYMVMVKDLFVKQFGTRYDMKPHKK